MGRHLEGVADAILEMVRWDSPTQLASPNIGASIRSSLRTHSLGP
jgi:hypothetical protein